MSICDLLGIEKPIIQAPMAGVQNWQLAVAVSNAGGLGSIPCGMLNKDQVIAEIEQFKQHSSRPYNLNFFCHDMPALDQQALDTWQQTLSPYYQSFSIEPPSTISGLRTPFDHELTAALETHQPPIISFHFGLPAPELMEKIKAWGTIVMSSATTLEEGIWLQDNGADIVIAQGFEAGGHRAMFLTSDSATQLHTSELVNSLSTALSIPVIAAGGIATNADINNLIKQGAAGVQLGTAYLLCDEANTSALHRQALKAVGATTALTNIFSGRLARGISNKVMQELNFVSAAAPKFPYASIAINPLRAQAEAQGRSDFTPLWSGTNREGCKEVSAAQLTSELWGDKV